MTNAARPASSATGNPAFDYAQGQPNLHRMMLLKQKLTGQLPQQQAFEEFLRTFNWQPRTLLPVTLEDERDYAKNHALFYRETAPGGLPFAHEPARIVGAGVPRRVEGLTRTQYVACLENAELRGRSQLVRVGDALLIDRQGPERGELDDEIEWDPVVFSAQGDQASYIGAANEHDPLRVEEAFSLMGCHSDFFGHWMCEYLPKYLSALMSGHLPNVPVLIDSWMPPSHREALELFAEAGIKIVEIEAFRSVHVRRLWCSPTLMHMPIHEKQNERFSWGKLTAPADRFAPVLALMAARAEARLGPHPPANRRVFLGRKHFRHRKLVNSAEIQQIAESCGFEVVYPEDHDLAHQIRILRESQFVIAPEGSAIYLGYAGASGTRLCILSHPLIDALAEYSATLATRGLETVAVTGPIRRSNEQTPHDSDYEIDAARFREFLDDWLSAP